MVAADDKERLLLEVLLGVLDAPRRPEFCLFTDVGDVDPEERPVTERFSIASLM